MNTTVPKGWASRDGRSRDVALEATGLTLTNDALTIVYEGRVTVAGRFTCGFVGGRRVPLQPVVVAVGDWLTMTYLGRIHFDEDNL